MTWGMKECETRSHPKCTRACKWRKRRNWNSEERHKWKEMGWDWKTNKEKTRSPYYFLSRSDCDSDCKCDCECDCTFHLVLEKAGLADIPLSRTRKVNSLQTSNNNNNNNKHMLSLFTEILCFGNQKKMTWQILND